MDSTEKKAYTVSEVAQLLGIGKNTAYNLVNRADFPKIIIGRRFLIPAGALESWLMDASRGDTDA